MAYDKVVDSSALNANLTSVANAIRTASGATGNLAFPAGFVSALQNMKMVAEVHKVTLSSDQTGAKDVTLLSGNAFIKKYYNNQWFSVVMFADSPKAATGVVPFNYQGNRVIGAANEGVGFRYTSASAVGTQPLNTPISGDGWSQHLRAKSNGNLIQYLSANYILAAGTYTIVLICAEA
jgi:hypothetical protein